MDKKTEARKLKENRKLKKRAVLERQEYFLDEQLKVTLEANEVQTKLHSLEKAYEIALSAGKDYEGPSLVVIKEQMTYFRSKLEDLSKREKMLTEEIELLDRAMKSKSDSTSGKWMAFGSIAAVLSSLGLSGFGLVKSYKAFDDGQLVDKGTRSLAEKIDPLRIFGSLFKKK